MSLAAQLTLAVGQWRGGHFRPDLRCRQQQRPRRRVHAITVGQPHRRSLSRTRTAIIAVNVTPNNWKIQISPERLSRRGYLTLQGNALTVNATLGSVADANIGLYQGNALFYGQLTITNTPIPNIAVDCNDENQILHGKSYTDANGDYAVVALINTNLLGTNDYDWNCSPNVNNTLSGQAFANYIVQPGGKHCR